MSAADDWRFDYRNRHREVSDEEHARLLRRAQEHQANRLDLVLREHYPSITPEGIEALSETEWELISSLAKLQVVAAQPVRVLLVDLRRRLDEAAGDDPFSCFPREAS